MLAQPPDFWIVPRSENGVFAVPILQGASVNGLAFRTSRYDATFPMPEDPEDAPALTAYAWTGGLSGGTALNGSLASVLLEAPESHGQMWLWGGPVPSPSRGNPTHLGVFLSNLLWYEATPSTVFGHTYCEEGAADVGRCQDWITAYLDGAFECRDYSGSAVPCHGPGYVLVPYVRAAGLGSAAGATLLPGVE